MDQASKAPKNFNPKSFKFKESLKNLKNNNSNQSEEDFVFESRLQRI